MRSCPMSSLVAFLPSGFTASGWRTPKVFRPLPIEFHGFKRKGIFTANLSLYDGRQRRWGSSDSDAMVGPKCFRGGYVSFFNKNGGNVLTLLTLNRLVLRSLE